MATYKIGKLKFNVSKAGFAFRWGDGKIQRFPFGLKADEDADVAEGLDSYGAEEYYDDAQADYGYDDGQGEDGYNYDDAAGDDAYGDDYGYDDGHYDDEYGQDGDYADDGYDGYAQDDHYADDGYGQDDGYGDYAQDEDYDDGAYAQDDGAEDYEDYYDEDGEYVGEEEPASSFMQYIDENDWVTYVLLVLFPPLGIYLLWRRGRFDMPMRAGISGASALWFVLIIYAIVQLVSSGMNDPNQPAGGPTVSLLSPTPTVTVEASVLPSASATVQPSASGLPGLDTSPSATPIASVSPTTGTETGEYVYAGTTGLYYHSNPECSNINGSASYVSLEVAQRRGLSACPICYNQTTYYMTDGGQWYHTNRTCDGGTGEPMVGAYEVTLQQAQNAGKTACPVCAGGTQQSNNGTVSNYITGDRLLSFVRSLSSDGSGLMVYARPDGQYFHIYSDCSGMTGASYVSMLTALQYGIEPCPTCCSAARAIVYCTENGTWFHSIYNCDGGTGSAMRNATGIPLAGALVMGKTACPVCMSGFVLPDTSGGAGSGTEAGSGSEEDGTVYVYATESGRYYHTDSTCDGGTGSAMRNAQRVTLMSMLQIGREACPVCCSSANRTVYATSGGTYYHSYATCSGMSGATAGTLAQALALGYQRCPYCWSSDGGSGESGGNEGSDEIVSVSGVTVYCTENGQWYHTDRYCQGMRNASAVSLEQAVAMGKTACETCCAIANRTVYAIGNGGQYYHYSNTCTVENMAYASSGTLAQALMAGYAPCPSCVSGSGNEGGSTTPVANYTPGTSGIRVYATPSGAYYHLSSSCAGSGASYITLETALNYGKRACPTCAAATAERTVWATATSSEFHIYRSHAPEDAVQGYLSVALAMGKQYCQVCLSAYNNDGQVPDNSDTFQEGTSGIGVYASLTDEYFHLDSSHAGSGAYYVPLERALNYGKSPCPTCASVAATVVYGTSSDPYYHTNQAHAGSGAVGSYLAFARAWGKTACPVCAGGSGGGGTGTGGGGTGTGGSGGDPSTVTAVYIDLKGNSNGNIFHSNSVCSGAGMTNGSLVAVEFVQAQGFSPCPYCW